MELFPGFGPLLLSVKLAALTTLILLIIGTPLAWWLSTTRARFKPLIETIVALPIVLPPTVMGFYFLILLSPQSVVGSWWLELTGETLTFSFSGLVIASVLYSFPFVVQPLQSAFEGISHDLMEAAYTRVPNRWMRFSASPCHLLNAVFLPLAYWVLRTLWASSAWF